MHQEEGTRRDSAETSFLAPIREGPSAFFQSGLSVCVTAHTLTLRSSARAHRAIPDTSQPPLLSEDVQHRVSVPFCPPAGFHIW